MIKISLPSFIEKILYKMKKNGFQSFLVGGALRDILIKKTPKDWDLATNALPSDVLRLFTCEKIGIEFGSITALFDNQKIRITTFRTEKYKKNNRKPDVEFTNDIKKDSKRRDFTINSLYYNEESGIIDFYNGIKDIEKKIIKSIGDPYEKFQEDYQRIFRAIRFSSELNFEIENKTLCALTSFKKIPNINSNLIKIEFEKTLMAESPISLNLFFNNNLSNLILPMTTKYFDLSKIQNKNNIQIEKLQTHKRLIDRLSYLISTILDSTRAKNKMQNEITLKRENLLELIFTDLEIGKKRRKKILEKIKLIGEN